MKWFAFSSQISFLTWGGASISTALPFLLKVGSRTKQATPHYKGSYIKHREGRRWNEGRVDEGGNGRSWIKINGLAVGVGDFCRCVRFDDTNYCRWFSNACLTSRYAFFQTLSPLMSTWLINHEKSVAECFWSAVSRLGERDVEIWCVICRTLMWNILRDQLMIKT